MARTTRSGSRRKAPVRRRQCGRPAPGGSCSRDTRVGADRLSASGEGRVLQIARVHPGPLRSFPSVAHSRRVQMWRMSWRSRLESLRLRRSRMRSWIAAKSSAGGPRSVAEGRHGPGSRRPGGCCCLRRPLRARTPSPIQTECGTTHSPHGCVDNINGRNTTCPSMSPSTRSGTRPRLPRSTIGAFGERQTPSRYNQSRLVRLCIRSSKQHQCFVAGATACPTLS